MKHIIAYGYGFQQPYNKKKSSISLKRTKLLFAEQKKKQRFSTKCWDTQQKNTI